MLVKSTVSVPAPPETGHVVVKKSVSVTIIVAPGKNGSGAGGVAAVKLKPPVVPALEGIPPTLPPVNGPEPVFVIVYSIGPGNVRPSVSAMVTWPVTEHEKVS